MVDQVASPPVFRICKPATGSLAFSRPPSSTPAVAADDDKKIEQEAGASGCGELPHGRFGYGKGSQIEPMLREEPRWPAALSAVYSGLPAWPAAVSCGCTVCTKYPTPNSDAVAVHWIARANNCPCPFRIIAEPASKCSCHECGDNPTWDFCPDFCPYCVPPALFSLQDSTSCTRCNLGCPGND